MNLNPVLSSQKIFERYVSYITTTFRLKDESLNQQIKSALNDKFRFSKGPIIEATPPFKTGKSIRQLINEGILTSSFAELKAASLPMDRSLYLHQEKTIMKICQEQRNAVVATGTGSGKTEAFIIPILNHLLTEKQNHKLTPGVRALLLYPMNALANDQMKRLRELLKNCPEITFGIYTGETEEKYRAAYDKFQRMHQQPSLPNELISREQMKESPPQILLTNYAMLEYLMLRPADNVFFQGPYSNSWKFIVIDEAHTYTGAKGIEMAMLIARLKSTIGIEEGQLTCIMTSASLGNGQEDFSMVADFASKIYREPFEPGDIIGATKKTFTHSAIWGIPEPNLYKNINLWLDSVGKDKQELRKILVECQVPEATIEEAYHKENTYADGALYLIMSGDGRVDQTIRSLVDGPMALEELAQKLFPNDEQASLNTAYLIDLCNRLRRHEYDHSLLPARYHYLVKALEGAFIVFTEQPKVYLSRINQVTIGQMDYKAFEIGACIKCNSIYLVGEVLPGIDKPYLYLSETKNRYADAENANLEYFALLEQEKEIDQENEDVLLEGTQLKIPPFSVYRLCVYCGAIQQDNGTPVCDCVHSKTVRLLKVNHKNQKVHKCGICGSINPTYNIVRRFFVSEDAVSSVLATTLYQELPNKQKAQVQNDSMKNDLFGFLDNDIVDTLKTIKSHKQLLVFSDSRQNAAYFAPYLSRTYNDLLIKNAMVRTIESQHDLCIANRWTLDDYYHRIDRYVRETAFSSASVETLRRDIWKWIMLEFAVVSGANSLENLGLIHFQPNFDGVPGIDNIWRIPALKKFGFKQEELPIFYEYILDQFRVNRAIEYPEYVSPQDPVFAPQNQQGGFWRQKPIGDVRFPRGYSLKSWLPAHEHFSNVRMDFLKKVLSVGSAEVQKSTVQELLGILWESMTDLRSPLVKYLKNEMLPKLGKIYKLDPQIYCVAPGMNNPDVTYYQCDTCFKISKTNLRDVCPTYRCEGKLHIIDMDKRFDNNHYRNLYLNIKPEKMIASEHTAQLTTEYAAEVQNQFIKGEVNVLSCSTTFELGVDVGELETVFMKNMPPTPANYAQRAGRAGRRTDSTAYALTFARLSSHDFNGFKDPNKMISGVVKPPYFEVANEKIVLRHLYACAFAHFWRQYPSYFKTVKDFFMSEPAGPALFRQFLDSKPQALFEMLQEVTPDAIKHMVKLESWGWVDDLYGERGAMTKVISELTYDLNSIQQAIDDALKKEHYGRANTLSRIRNTITERPLINYFSQKNLLPKYGFPVDVVGLDINLHTDEAKNIDLSRDLQIAISEYAPESQVVANGKLWTSRYVKRVANRELVRYSYIQCSCGFFRKNLDLEKVTYSSCPVCGSKRVQKGTFVIPEFGFISDSIVGEPGDAKPEKTYSSRKHFSGSGEYLQEKTILVNKTRIALNTQTHGVLTVINSGIGYGFYLCKFCGYGSIQEKPKSHNNPNGIKCSGNFERVSLGYDFETDILEISFIDRICDKEPPTGYWESLLYSIIEGMSASLEINRDDIDGTLHINKDLTRSMILFDTVPGGAGHVKRMLDEEQFVEVLKEARSIVSSCTCGAEKKDTSCYSCLRNYHNQYCHDYLRRVYAIDALNKILGD
ncbi:ATP-dependent RNA helicase RhlE [Sporotomaculum syntrophicum]|uniref:ATP-dependent RNA helicase RhlE n=1 Tax=Sporotomaculum syntrophicum TaxID=182264 RepID=A0A9D2WNB1_9FIRM|nr:DEAD/DEAH box helicase [Sporotomaculum syntrophicum]KAF1084349.1 ATP-dependent RNA helicase RhlE [Sporotomaculum syntrophicum]